MTPTRREFIQSLGMTLASLALARCALTPDPETIVTCYIVETVEVERQEHEAALKKLRRQRVRDCWLRFDWLAQQSQTGWEEADLAKEELTMEHRAALERLVAAGEMGKDVSAYVQMAFVAAVNHIIVANPPELIPGCYEPIILEGTPTPMPQVDQVARQLAMDYASVSGERLAQQAELLAELAATSDIDPDTIAQAQSAVQRDMMLLSPGGPQDVSAVLIEAAGGTYDFPPIEQLDLDIPPEAAEAARFLVELLLEE